MPVKHKRQVKVANTPPETLTRLWALRTLVKHSKGFPTFLGDAEITDFLGITDLIVPLGDEFEDRAKSLASISNQMQLRLPAELARAERSARQACAPEILVANVKQITTLIGLNFTEARLLEFAILNQTHRVLREITDLLGELSARRLYQVLPPIIGLPEKEIRQAFSSKGALAQSGLLKVERSASHTLANMLDLISYSFAERMLSEEGTPLDLLRDRVAQCPPATLTLDDFQHVGRDLELLRAYLRIAIGSRRSGVNILIYGPPGTGKTQIARVLTNELGMALFEVASEDEEGDPLAGEARLRAYRASQYFFAQTPTLMVFDEAEDVFGGGGASYPFSFMQSESIAQKHKAWVNRMLESNPAPTFWLSNSTGGIDPAFLRRFDMVIELSIPPVRQRERIVRRVSESLLPEESIQRLARSEQLAPAVVARALAVIGSIHDQLPADSIAGAVERLVDNTLRVQGHPVLDRAEGLPAFYDPGFVQVDADLDQIAAGLARSGRGRLCLYGPPGTGKTAFGRWLAERLGRPLLTRRVSSLIGKWVGESEKNLAGAFHEAETENAVLLLDEVDSYLQDRRGALRSWEVTLVNEMLTQMESCNGIFIASTNLVDGLDQAALRRFDLKLKFGYLKPDQAWGLFKRQCAAMSLPVSDTSLRATISRLDVLTPGDFAAVARRHGFSPLADAVAVMEALTEECALKDGGQRHAMGFIGARPAVASRT